MSLRLEASLGFLVSTKLAWAIGCDTVLKY